MENRERTNESPVNDGRISSVELLRSVAAFAVILIHFAPFDSSRTLVGQGLRIFIDQVSRFAVQAFLIIAGYFWNKKVCERRDTWAVFRIYGTRILRLFAIWSVIYFVIPSDFSDLLDGGLPIYLESKHMELRHLLWNPLELIFQGPAVHLWYLIGLLCALLLSSALVLCNLRAMMLPIATSLYIVGLLLGSYGSTAIGFAITFNTRNGPFMTMLPFVLGSYLFTTKRTPAIACGVTLAVVGCLLHMAEVFILWRTLSVNALSHDFLAGTLPFALGVTIVALAKPSLGKGTRTSRLGKYTLGIYLIHPLVLIGANRLQAIMPLALLDIPIALAVYCVSAALVSVLFRFKLTRKLVQ